MSSSQDQQVRAALRDLVDAVPVEVPPPGAVRARASSRGARTADRWRAPVIVDRWRSPAIAATAALAVVVVVAVASVWLLPLAGQLDSRLPERIDTGSGHTASVAGSPPGRAIAIFAYGGDRRSAELVVVGADGDDVYRHLDAATLRELGYGSGNSASDLVLSPDGTRLAGPDGYVIDLATGNGSRYPIPIGDPRYTSVAPVVGWSPDSRVVGYGLPAGLALLDLTSGEVSWLGVDTSHKHPDARRVAFSPDGAMLAVSARAPRFGEPGKLVVLDRQGTQLRELELAPGRRLAGHGTGWSPDGRLLVVQETDDRLDTVFTFVDATGSGAQVPAPIKWPHGAELLGWRSPHTMLVALHERSNGPTSIAEVPVDGGAIRVVSRLPAEPSGRPFSLHLASGLLPDAQVGPPGWPWRVPAATPQLVAATAGVGTALLLLVGAWHRTRRRQDRTG